MTVSSPHYLLYSDDSDPAEPGRWRFVLRASSGSRRLEVKDVEPEERGERLELLTVVRGLEALEEPSRVTLVTPSVYVREGIRHGLAEWRRNGWRWERFGEMVPVKNLDLWQRIDRAMQFHEIDCRTYRIDLPHGVCSASPSQPACRPRRASAAPAERALEYHASGHPPGLRRRLFARLQQFRQTLARWTSAVDFRLRTE